MIFLLRNQKTLPLLPIPSLDNLMDFLDWIKPLVEDEEFEASQESLKDFMLPYGDGEKLQKKLIEVSAEQRSSWLKPLWDEMYLEYRRPLVCNMNYYAILENERLKSYYTVPTLGAKFIYELINIYAEISDRSLSPQFAKGNPLCMDQYTNIFKSVRLPLLKKDVYKTYPFTKTHHIVVFYNNNIFKIETSDSDGNIVSIDRLASDLQSILNSNTEDRGNDIGGLTTANRDDASILYEAIESDMTNKGSLEIINTAIFVLCIDPARGALRNSQEMMLLSTGKNRYFDKSCQIILSEDLDIGFNLEHTGADATVWFSIIDRTFNKILEDRNKKVDIHHTPLPEELKWNLCDDTKSKLKVQLNKHQGFANNLYVDNLKFHSFGKSMIKSLKISPDAFFHIALQVAQYKTFGKLRSTYESVAMMQFNHGRTESARAVNEDVSKFVRAIESNDCSKDQLKELLVSAQNAHINRIKKCQKGFGIERHLFGLYKMYEKYGKELGIQNTPSLFTSPGYNILKHDFISTSCTGFESVNLFGFGPVVNDGYGIGYVVKNETINVTLSSNIQNKDKSMELLNNLSNAFLILKDIASSEL